MLSDVLALAECLIAVPSVYGDDSRLDEVMTVAEDALCGHTVELFGESGARSLLAYRGGVRPERFRVLLNGHLDVVQGCSAQFSPRVQGGRLYGRGAYDMKAACAVELAVFSELAAQLDYPLGLQLVCDEEVGGWAGTQLQIREGVTSDFIIVGEPTDLCIGNESKGVLWATIRFCGESAHGAYPWLGRNAVKEMNEFLTGIGAVYPESVGEVWRTTVSAATVVTRNEAFNRIPDRCELKLDIRVVPDEMDDVVQQIKKLLPSGASMEIVLQAGAHRTSAANVFIRSLAAAGKAVLENDVQLVARHGTSDLRFYGEAGCAAVEFGPVGSGHHSREEWVDVASLGKYHEILRRFLLSWSDSGVG